MSRLIKHKDEKQQREDKVKENKSKQNTISKSIKVKYCEEPFSIKHENIPKTTLCAMTCLAIVLLTLTSITILNVYDVETDSPYITEAKPIYNSGYDSASKDIWYSENTDQSYLEQLKFIEKYGGGKGFGKHYITNINSNDGINDVEEKLIYAAGYTNGFADSMIHGYDTQRNNIPE